MKRQVVLFSMVIIGLLSLSMNFVSIKSIFVHGPGPIFSATLMVPTNCPISYAKQVQAIVTELSKIGINIEVIEVGWDILIPRLFEPSDSVGLSYADGGYDMAKIGWSGGLLPTTQYWLFHSSFAPDPNCFGIQNTTLDALLELTVNTTDIAQRKQYIEDAWMELTWHHQAEIVLYQIENVVYMRDNVKGYSSDLRVPGTLGIAEMYFEDGHSAGHGQVNEFIMASTTRPNKYNDLIENDWYNQLAIAQLNHGMVERDSDYNFFPVLLTKLPYPVAIKNNHTGLESSLDPNWATVWEIELRNDVYWHEGYGYNMTTHEDILHVDADDILFTFDLILNENGPNPCTARENWQYLLGTNASLAVIKKDRYHVQFHLQTVDADLLTYFEQRLFPQHILELGTMRVDGSVAPTDYVDWTTDDWNLGHRDGGQTGPAVIGNGPYILWPGEDSIAQTIIETKNPYWHLKNESAYVNMFDKYIYRWITGKDAALAALEEVEIDLMDSQFHAEKDYPVMANKSGIFTQKILDWGCQTISINTAHGAGGLTDHRVRLAISHMIPRQEMVDSLLGGLGQPAFMHFPIQNPFYPHNVPPITYNFTKAIEYMEAAGYDMDPFKNGSPITNPGFEVFAFFIALGGMTAVVLIYRHKKALKQRKNKIIKL